MKNENKKKSLTSFIVAFMIVAMIPILATPAFGYDSTIATYTWDASTPNYNPSAKIYPGTIDLSCLVTGDFLGRGPAQPHADAHGDSGAIVRWDDSWVSWVGDPNTNGDALDGLWAQIEYPSQGWWDIGFQTDEVVVFLSQDHGPYLAEGLETWVYGSNTLWGAKSSPAVLTDVYLDGWRTHNPAEDANGNGWCSDDIAGVYKLPGKYQYVIIEAWSPYGTLNEPEVDAIAAIYRTIDKTLSSSEGELGDTVHVTITLNVPAGETVTVCDTLPKGFHYVKNTFIVDGISAKPKVIKNDVSYTITDAGDHVIEFDVKIDEAKNWEDMEVCNIATATWYDDAGNEIETKEDVECFTILAFEELHKNVGIPKADVVFAIDLTGSMSGEIATVKTEATNIMNNLAAQIADVQFGLISFMDYDGTYSTTEPGSFPLTYTAQYGQFLYYGDYPYLLDQDITSNKITMATKINALSIGWGADGPQDYTRIIHESWNDPFLNWRTDAVRFLILFGDDVPHDTNFDNNNDGTPDNRGGDPGRDTILGNTDDLDFETEVANAAAAGVHIMSVYSGSIGTKYPWTYMADETDGGYYELTSASDIPDAINELIKEEAQETLTVKVGEDVQWAIVMDVINTFSYTMEDTIIKDNFGAEIELDDADPSTPEIDEVSITHGTWSYRLKGKSKKVSLHWEIGDILPGETARLILLVSTDKNPAGHQAYTSPGIYELNSGATLKFIDPEQDVQLSAYTDSIYVKVEEDPCEKVIVENEPEINLPRARTVQYPLLQGILQRFPRAFSIIRYILQL